VLFFPEFDQIYPLFFMLTVYYWQKALEYHFGYLFLFAVSMFISVFFAYNLLTVGAPIILFSAFFVHQSENRVQAFIKIARCCLGGLGLFLGFQLILYLSTGHNSVLAFLNALDKQANVIHLLPRPYFATIFTDIYDFFLGSGFLTIPLLILFVLNSFDENILSEHSPGYSYIGLLTIIIIDLTGLLRCETARVWLFLQPLLMVPVGIELSRFNKAFQYVLLLLLFAILVSIKANMWFISPFRN
jgi:hypothetical protein